MEFNNLVSILSSKASQIFTRKSAIRTRVTSVERFSTPAEQWVYNISVEENENYFADGVLTHNCGIIDDPLKNSEEAESELIRTKQKDWFLSTFLTRAEPDAAIVVIQTRWHEDDLSGWLLSDEMEGEEPQRWHVVRMEAIKSEEADPIPDTCTLHPDWRETGEALCPERYPIAKLSSLKKTMGGYHWAALYDQTPRDREGNFFKRAWFEIVNAAPVNALRVRWWDFASSDSPTADQTAGVLMAWADGIYYVEDVVCGRWSSQARDRIIYQTAQMDYDTYGGTVKTWREQEPGSSGKDAARAFIRMLAGFSAHAKPSTGAKEVRADPFASQAEAGNVKIVRGAWNKHYLDELVAAWMGKHDDQIDGTSGAFNKLAQMNKERKQRKTTSTYTM